MKKFLLMISVAACTLFACKSDPPAGQDTPAATADSTAALERSTAPTGTVRFICQPSPAAANTQDETPHHELFVQIGDSRVKVADINACDAILPDTYEQYQIPAIAITAAGGWWAGAGDYFYIILNGENYEVKQGSMGEGIENNDYGYKTVMTLSREGKEVI